MRDRREHREHRTVALEHLSLAETVPESHAGYTAFASVRVLLAIDLALLRIARGVERIARTLEGGTLGLHATIVPKGDQMTQLPALTLDVAHDLSLVTSPKDADGNPTTPTLRWEASDPQSIFSLTVSPDTLSARAVTTGNLGQAVIAVTDGTVTDSVAADVSAVPPPPPGTLNLAASVVPKL